jgi:hypothetical protein
MHRRRSSRDWDEDDDAPGFVEVLISSLTDRLARSAVERVQQGVREIVHWTTSRLIACWIGTAVLMAGVLLVLFAGVKGLQALECPLWLASLSMGILALAVALLVLRRTSPIDRDGYLD